MAGKGRPLTNRSNYWHPNGLALLEAAAVRVLSRMDRTRTGFVSKDELVAEGWWLSFRYCKGEHQLKYQFLHAVRHMQTAYIKIRYEQSGKKTQLHAHPLPDRIEPEHEPYYTCPYGQLGMEAVDLLDEVTT